MNERRAEFKLAKNAPAGLQPQEAVLSIRGAEIETIYHVFKEYENRRERESGDTDKGQTTLLCKCRLKADVREGKS